MKVQSIFSNPQGIGPPKGIVIQAEDENESRLIASIIAVFQTGGDLAATPNVGEKLKLAGIRPGPHQN